MKSGVKVLFFCGCAFGFWSTQALAVPVIMEMQVVKINGVDVTPTATVTIDPLDTIEVEFLASDWTPFIAFLYQVRLDGTTLGNTPDSYIELHRPPCVEDDDCGSGGCDDDGACNCRGSISNDSLRPEFLFFKIAMLFAGSCPDVLEPDIPPRSYVLGALVLGPDGAPDIDVFPNILGNMTFQASEGFCESVTVSLLDDINETWFTDGSVPSFDLDLRSLTINSTNATCPNPCDGIVASVPADCSIDARQPHDLNNAGLTEGWDFIDLTLNDPCEASTLTADNFTLFEIGFFDIELDIASVEPLGGSDIRVHFVEQIDPGKWICVNFSGAPIFERVCLGYLPGDVDQNRMTGTADILGMLDCLNDVASFDCELFNTDVDRSNDTGAPDLLREIDLLNGAAAFSSWQGETLPICP